MNPDTVAALADAGSARADSGSRRAEATVDSARAEAAAETVRVRFDIAYDGSDFHGWATQRGLRTVAGTIEEALSLVCRHPIALTVAGRTDAGVHADAQVAHADIPRSAFGQRSLATPDDLVRRLARILPADVRVHGARTAPEGFDARFSALRRHYVYRITTNPAGPLPRRARDTATWRRPIDLELANAAAAALVGLHDFAALCKAKEHATTIRDLQEFRWVDVSTAAEPDTYEAHVSADAFCWSMVRSLVGATLSVADGRRAEDFTAGLLAEQQRSPLVPVAEARGLTLVGVDYPADADMAARAEATRARRDDAGVGKG